MKFLIIFSNIYILSVLSMGYSSTIITAKLVNDRPIIGVLSQELSHSLQRIEGAQNFSSYIAASYVKYLEGAGARVVPIMINKEQSYYEEMINSINGLLIPGGANFYNSSGYGLAGGIMYDLAVTLNQRGDFFPIWGTCLGFELLIYLMSGKVDPRITCDAWDQANSLNLEPGYLDSKMLSSAPDNVLDILKFQTVTSNFHRFCVTKEGLASANLDQPVRVLATSVDKQGLQYVAALESRTMPFYAVQFHPEKPLYEWNTKEKSIPHSASAIIASSYFAQFFVNEARKSGHKFSSPEEENSKLIYNYNPIFTGAQNKTYEQCYLF